MVGACYLIIGGWRVKHTQTGVQIRWDKKSNIGRRPQSMRTSTPNSSNRSQVIPGFVKKILLTPEESLKDVIHENKLL